MVIIKVSLSIILENITLTMKTLLDIYQDSIIIVYQKFSNEKKELKNSSLKLIYMVLPKTKYMIILN